MVVVVVHRDVVIEVSHRVDGRAEHDVGTCIPVAVDVLGLGLSSTIVEIGNLVRDAVSRCREVGVGIDEALAIHDVVIEAQVEALGERRLQVRITSGFAHGVGIVVDIEQLLNGRLAGGAAIVEAQLALL